MHLHHIIPKHTGGTDELSNIELLTVEEHAIAHWVLWIQHGQWQDKLAYQTLSGQVTNEEANRVVNDERRKKISLARKGRKFGPFSEAAKLRMSQGQKGKKQPGHTEEFKERMSILMRGNKNGAGNLGRKASMETRIKQSEAARKRTRTPLTEEHKRKIRLANLGKKRSIETRQRISRSKLGTKYNVKVA